MGRLGERDFVATIEPWHGPQVVVYREEAGLALHRGEVEVGRLGERDFVATIEPWQQVVVYREEAGSWERQVIDEIGSGHTIVTADFDGDGRDEIVYYRRGI